MSKDKLKGLSDFAHFLKSKSKSFSYEQVEDRAEYVKKLRIKRREKSYVREKIY